ncbi:MAG TPA: hypothetical protein VJL28_14830 [Gemmatimonadaceae bacterium]|nr:hypothetical protein [Gemmatimonadaceae bacterium]
MTGSRRRAISTPGERRDPVPRGPGGFLVSLAVHAVAIALLLRVVVLQADYLTPPGTKAQPIIVERIGFLAVPRAPTPQRETPRAGGDNRPARAAPAPTAPPVVAPPAVPSGIPTAPPPAASARDTLGAGPVVGAGGVVPGVRPSFSDPRIWAPSAPVVVAPMSPQQRMDSVIAARVRAFEDSMAALPTERAPGDWTFTHRGKTYGIDRRYIHLGDFSLPTAVLALLPMNATANPVAVERERRLRTMRGEIQEQAARVARDEDFRAAVRALRERKEKERADQQKKRPAEPAPARPAPDRDR